MADENADLSVKNTSDDQANAAPSSVRVGTRLPDETGKPKRRRRRRRRRAGSEAKNTQVPDSVLEARQADEIRAREQRQARLEKVSQSAAADPNLRQDPSSRDSQDTQDVKTDGRDVDNTDTPEKIASSTDKKSTIISGNGDVNPVTSDINTSDKVDVLPTLMVNGKPYVNPQSKNNSAGATNKRPRRHGRGKGAVEDAISSVNQNSQTIPDAQTRTKTVFAGKQSRADKEGHAGGSIIASALAQVEAEEKQAQEVIESAVDTPESPVLAEMLAQKDVRVDAGPGDSPGESARDKQKHRFTPHLQAGNLKNATPTFSLQDIQRARRRRRLFVTVVFLLMIGAFYFLWAGVRRARQSVSDPGDRQTAQVASPSPQTSGREWETAALSGRVRTETVRFPSATLDRVAVYIRYGGEQSFRDTGIRLMQGENEWSFSQAEDGEEYDIQAVLIDNGREIAYTNVVHATAPAAGLELYFPEGAALSEVAPTRPVLATEPVLQLSESPTVSGLVQVNGNFPPGAQVVIWLGENTGSQTQQDAYTFSISTAQTAYTIGDLQVDREYVMDAVLQTADGQVIANAEQSLLVYTSATDANFVINVP